MTATVTASVIDAYVAAQNTPRPKNHAHAYEHARVIQSVNKKKNTTQLDGADGVFFFHQITKVAVI